LLPKTPPRTLVRPKSGQTTRTRMTSASTWGECGALGGTRTPNLLIRRSMEHVRSVRRNPYPLVSVLPGVRNRRHGPAPSGQSVRKL
jgi:hypothetical protein